MYPWPFGEFDAVMDDALDIAMDYLTRTGQAVRFKETQATAANTIACAWHRAESEKCQSGSVSLAWGTACRGCNERWVLTACRAV